VGFSSISLTAHYHCFSQESNIAANQIYRTISASYADALNDQANTICGFGLIR